MGSYEHWMTNLARIDKNGRTWLIEDVLREPDRGRFSTIFKKTFKQSANALVSAGMVDQKEAIHFLEQSPQEKWRAH